MKKLLLTLSLISTKIINALCLKMVAQNKSQFNVQKGELDNVECWYKAETDTFTARFMIQRNCEFEYNSQAQLLLKVKGNIYFLLMFQVLLFSMHVSHTWFQGSLLQMPFRGIISILRLVEFNLHNVFFLS